jgi:SAM-dependent methyltransferase
MEKLSSKKSLNFLSEPYPVSMADEWFQFATKDHFWMKWRFEVVQRAFQKFLRFPPVDQKYLEIGCGHGQFIEQFEFKNGVPVDGCDLNLFALEKINAVMGDVFVYDIFKGDQKMVNKYDVIFLLDVVEHIDDDVAFLKAASQHLKGEGTLIISVPALSSLFSKYDVQAGHKRRYDTNSVRRLLIDSGITPVYIGYWGFLLLPVALVRKYYLKLFPQEKVINKGFVPPSKFVKWLLGLTMAVELKILKAPFLGTSVIAVGKRTDT